MEPDHYIEYSTVFDSLSGLDLFPVLHFFITDIVLPLLKPDARVTDIGAGTGYFSAMLLDRLPNLQLTLVEPSPEMLNLAKNRLTNRVNYLEMTADSAIDLLPQQDAFIFQRSLYVIYQNELHCKKLFEKLRTKLSDEGCIFIQDFNQKMDVEHTRAYLLDECAKSPDQRKELAEKFIVIEKYMTIFNQRVDAGVFHLFSKEELESFMARVGFKLLISDGDSCYAFQRIANTNE